MSANLKFLCDDFFVEMYVNTELDLPSHRDTLLSFFERVQRQYPSMGKFYCSSGGNYFLEDGKQGDSYRWVALEHDRICSVVVNPSDFEESYRQHKLILELIPYMLSVSHLDINSLDVTFGMDFEYEGNHDEVILEALFSESCFKSFFEMDMVKVRGFSPVAVFSLSDDGNTEARISIESKTDVYESSKRGRSSDSAISLSFSIRQYPSGIGKFNSQESFVRQCGLAEELLEEKIVPHFVHPLRKVISKKRLIS